MTRATFISVGWLLSTIVGMFTTGILTYQMLGLWDPVYAVMATTAILITKAFDNYVEEFSLRDKLSLIVRQRLEETVNINPCECVNHSSARVKLKTLLNYEPILTFFTAKSYEDDTKKLVKTIQSAQLFSLIVSIIGTTIVIVQAQIALNKGTAVQDTSSFAIFIAAGPLFYIVGTVWIPIIHHRRRNDTV